MIRQLQELVNEAGDLYGPDDYRTQAMADTRDFFVEVRKIGKDELDIRLFEMDLYMLIRTELTANRDPRVAVRQLLKATDKADPKHTFLVEELRNLDLTEHRLRMRMPTDIPREDIRRLAFGWFQQAKELRKSAQMIDTSTPEASQRAQALLKVATELEAASHAYGALQGRRATLDPRPVLLEAARALEARTFLDGLDGAGEASILRAAAAEYASMLDDFRALDAVVPPAVADNLARPGLIANPGRVDVGTQTHFDKPPAYPGLPDEFGVADELWLTPDQLPSYEKLFPPPTSNVPAIDEVRRGLEIQPEQLGDAVSDSVGTVARVDVNPELEQAGRPSFDDGGRWNGAAADGAAADTAGRPATPRGDYEDMASEGAVTAAAGDTQAIVDAIPGSPALSDLENLDYAEIHRKLYQGYLEHRRTLNYRATMAYEEVLTNLDVELRRALVEYAEISEESANMVENPEADRRLVQLAMEADNQIALDIQEVLARVRRQATGGLADLTARADEFAATRPIDTHIDQTKLRAWLQDRQDQAALRVAEASSTDEMLEMMQEMTYFQQLGKALDDGLDPVHESSALVVYIGRDGTKQGDDYLQLHGELMQIVSDPSYHRSAKELGDNTFAPSHFTRRPATLTGPIGTRPLPEGFDFEKTFTSLRDEYYKFRRASDWRGTLAYTDAMEAIRDDLKWGLNQFGGDADLVRRTSEIDGYRAIKNLLAQALENGDADLAARISEFLAEVDKKTYNLTEDLANQADVFAAAAKMPLDPHIDQAKLRSWLEDQQAETMRQMQEAIEAGDPNAIQETNHRATYYQQMVRAISEGRSPLLESNDQIVYLRSMGAKRQVEVLMEEHTRLIEVMADPTFHKSALDMGESTYAPVHMRRPELGRNPFEPPTTPDPGNLPDDVRRDLTSGAVETPASGAGQGSNGIERDVFRAEVEEAGASPGDVGDGRSRNYEANRDAINRQTGPNDYVQAPNEQPAGLRPIDEADEPGVVHGPATFEETLDQRIQSARRRSENLRPGGVGEYMSRFGEQRAVEAETAYYRHLKQHGGRLHPLVAEQSMDEARRLGRLEAANNLWGAMPTTRSSARRRLHFGDSQYLTFRNGVLDTVETMDTSQSVRHVPTPSRRWQPTRTPGFGRVADSAGAFPFNDRERFIADIMKGERISDFQVELFRGEFPTGHLNFQWTTAQGTRTASGTLFHGSPEWNSMAGLVENLGGGGRIRGTIDSPLSLDWKMIDKLFNALESSAIL